MLNTYVFNGEYRNAYTQCLGLRRIARAHHCTLGAGRAARNQHRAVVLGLPDRRRATPGAGADRVAGGRHSAWHAVAHLAWRQRRVQPGVAWTAKEVLEFAIVLLGASVDLPALLQGGTALLLSIVVLVAVGIIASVTVGRLIGLNPKLAILVAVGNSICGNSAIAAVAPVIKADADDIASSIALTAVLGVVVLALPLLIPLVGLTLHQYGILAGMTVYAVPQVLAATFPVSAISGEIGTLVKLVRVLLLGPVVLFFNLRQPPAERTGRFSITRFVPWFILGFIVLAVLRSAGMLPVLIADPLRDASRYLTVAAMAALGLGVDVRGGPGWPASGGGGGRVAAGADRGRAGIDPGPGLAISGAADFWYDGCSVCAMQPRVWLARISGVK